MRIAKTLPLSLALAGLATPALALEQGDTYIGGGYSMITYEADAIPDVEPTALITRFGYGVADQIAIEGRFGLGISDDEIGSTGLDAELDQLAGIYGVGYLPIIDRFSLYGLIGLTYGELSIPVPGTSVEITDDDTDFSYGFGGQFDFNDEISGFVEWAQYFDESDYEVTGLTLGLNVHF